MVDIAVADPAKGEGRTYIGGAATVRVREGGMGERCELPYRGLGWSPGCQRFLRWKTLQIKQRNENIITDMLAAPSMN